jgi:hypothetical protein
MGLGATGSRSSLLNNLSAYYKLGEASGTRADSTGNYPLTPTGNPGNTPGVVGNGLLLVKANTQYLSSATGPTFHGNDWTIVFWLNLTTNTTGDMYFETSAYLNGPSVRYTGLSTLTVTVGTGNTGTFATTGSWVMFSISKTYSTLAVAVLADNSALTSFTAPADDAVSTGFTIGGNQYGGTGTADAAFDEFGIWTSPPGGGGVLTAAQLTSLYNGGAGATYPFSGIR